MKFTLFMISFLDDLLMTVRERQWKNTGKWQKKKFVFIIFFLSFPPANSDFAGLASEKHDLPSISCTCAAHVLFLSVRRSWEEHLWFFFSDASKFPNWGEEAAVPNATRLAEAAWIFLMSVRPPVFFFFFFFLYIQWPSRACWLERWKSKAATQPLLFLLSQTQRSLRRRPLPLNHKTKSIFSHICYIIKRAGHKWKPVAAEIGYWLYFPYFFSLFVLQELVLTLSFQTTAALSIIYCSIIGLHAAPLPVDLSSWWCFAREDNSPANIGGQVIISCSAGVDVIGVLN